MAAMSPKQGSILFRFTGLKFWIPEQVPAPTMEQASAIIQLCFKWLKGTSPEDKNDTKKKIIPLVQKYFPDWNGDSLHRPFFKHKKSTGTPAASATPTAGGTPQGEATESDKKDGKGAPGKPEKADTGNPESADNPDGEQGELDLPKPDKPAEGDNETKDEPKQENETGKDDKKKLVLCPNAHQCKDTNTSRYLRCSHKLPHEKQETSCAYDTCGDFKNCACVPCGAEKKKRGRPPKKQTPKGDETITATIGAIKSGDKAVTAGLSDIVTDRMEKHAGELHNFKKGRINDWYICTDGELENLNFHASWLEFEKPEDNPDEKPQETAEDTPKSEDKPKDDPEQGESEETPQEAAEEANGEAEAHEDPTVSAIIKMIKAGIENIWLTGPAGCGKTWATMEASKVLNLPITILSCSAGTSASEFIGRRIPTIEPSAVSAAIGLPGIIVFDEVTMLDPAIAAVANALLANKIVQTTHGAIERKCIIISTSNTLGTGADRQYIGNNQLDAATLDRFTGGYIEVKYNEAYEKKNYPADVVKYVHGLRKIIADNNFRRIASTRAVIAASKMKKAGMKNWKEAIIETWTDEEKGLAL